MKKSFLLLLSITWAAILWGCTPKSVVPLPVIDLTQTVISTTNLPPKATVISELPDTWTPLPDTSTPSPSVTKTAQTLTVTPSPTDEWPELCQLLEFQTYFDLWAPLADQLFFLGQEAKQLEELPETRVREMLKEAESIETPLERIYAPPCMEDAHHYSVDSLTFLMSSLNFMLEQDYIKAKEELIVSLEFFAWALVDVSYLSTRETETSAQSQ
jgi:hypothetical protein